MINGIIGRKIGMTQIFAADGTHLGQDDLPPDEARKLVGDHVVIGFSTHSVQQAIEATSRPIDYLAIGPIYGTQTKQDPDPVVGLDGLKAVRDAIGGFPVVAIGGITRENARAVLDAGADSIALISDLLVEPARIEPTMRQLQEL